MESRKTERGFALTKFADHNGQECSLQKSSMIGPEAIWLGVDDPEILQEGWHPEWPARMRDLPKEERERLQIVMVGSRMHLTQEMVRELLPALQYFAETGELP